MIMRLWHYKLIPYLPKSQLLGQWRELNSIFAKQDKHILINYVYDYDKEVLLSYSTLVILEMSLRGYKIKSSKHFNYYFSEQLLTENVRDATLHFNEHDLRYMRQCYYNLQEKFDRGQADFSEAEFERLAAFCRKEGAI